MKVEPYKIEKLAKYYDEIADGYVSSEAGSQARENYYHMHQTFMKLANTLGVWDDIDEHLNEIKK